MTRDVPRVCAAASADSESDVIARKLIDLDPHRFHPPIIFKRMSKKPDSKPAAASDSASAPAGEEPTFSIQPHPAKTNNPADLLPEQTGGLASNPNEAVFHARDPHVPSAQILAGLEQPLSREELQKRQAELNKS